MAILIRILTGWLLAKRLFNKGESKMKSNSQGTKIALAIAAGYLLVRSAKQAKTTEASSNLQDGTGAIITNNVPNSTSEALAARLMQAFGGYQIPVLGWQIFANGTTEKEVFAVATEIAALKNYPLVFGSYSILYSRDLTNDLKAELNTEEFARFTKIINNQPITGSQTPTTQPTIPTNTTPPILPSMATKKVFAVSNVNVRKAATGNAQFYFTVAKGKEVGKYYGLTTFQVNGVKQNAYKVWTGEFFANGDRKLYLVSANPAYTKLV